MTRARFAERLSGHLSRHRALSRADWVGVLMSFAAMPPLVGRHRFSSIAYFTEGDILVVREAPAQVEHTAGGRMKRPPSGLVV